MKLREQAGADLEVGCGVGGVLGLGVEGADLGTVEEALEGVHVVGTEDWSGQGRGKVNDRSGHQR
ncbi:hypothetical protein D3C85_1752830 [compost metagenome]